MPFLTSADAFVGQWAPKMGREAAQLQWRSAKLSSISYLSMFIWTPGWYIGYRFHILPLAILGWVAFIASAICLVASSRFLVLSHRATGQLLGLRIGFLHTPGPPRERDHYLDWCRKYGVTPYAADTSHAPTSDPGAPP